MPRLLSSSSSPPSEGWHAVPLKQTILPFVSRLSSRVFLGEELCRDPAWLRITANYTTDAFRAAQELRLWPAFLRRIAVRFLPRCRVLRAEVSEASRLLNNVLEKRRLEKEAAVEPKEYHDMIEWFEQVARGRKYDPAIMQLGMSFAAIHTTTDMITQLLFDLARNPELIEPLRREVVTVLSEGGWRKSSLYKLKLLDSVIKESQRMKPIGFGKSAPCLAHHVAHCVA